MNDHSPDLTNGIVSDFATMLDDNLMVLAASGETGSECRAAFETLVNRHRNMVMGLATRFFGSKELPSCIRKPEKV